MTPAQWWWLAGAVAVLGILAAIRDRSRLHLPAAQRALAELCLVLPPLFAVCWTLLPMQECGVLAYVAVAILIVLLGIVYPLLMTGISQVLFPSQANGSLIRDSSGNVIGSALHEGPQQADAQSAPSPFVTWMAARAYFSFTASLMSIDASLPELLHQLFRLRPPLQITSRELTRDCLERIAAVEPRVNAFITVSATEAMVSWRAKAAGGTAAFVGAASRSREHKIAVVGVRIIGASGGSRCCPFYDDS